MILCGVTAAIYTTLVRPHIFPSDTTCIHLIVICRRKDKHPSAHVLKVKKRCFMFSSWQGGMKAVIWTDVFQSVVIFLGLLVVVIQVHVQLISWSKQDIVMRNTEL